MPRPHVRPSSAPPRPHGSRGELPLLLASVLVGGAFGACGGDETRERFGDDESATTSTTTTATTVSGAGGAGASVSSSGVITTAGPSTATTGTTSSGTTASASSSSSGTPCVDDGPEPNNSEATATDLGELGDCVGEATVGGVLAGNDVDWYTYFGTNGVCFAEPFRSIVADGTVRICKFVECPDLELECPEGTTAETSPAGREGCCATTEFELSYDCSGFGGDEDADIFIRLDKPPAFDCVKYTLTYYY